MSRTYNVYENGKLVAAYEDTPMLPRRRLSLTEVIAKHKRVRRDARLVNILTR